MKSFALFLLLVGVLTAGANTMLDDNISGEIQDAEFTEEDFEVRAFAGQVDDDGVDLDSMKSAIEERALAGNAAGHPVDVERRGFKCRGGKCEICIRLGWAVKGCVGGRLANGGIVVFARVGGFSRSKLVRVKQTFRMRSRWLRFFIYFTNISITPTSGRFCFRLKYRNKWYPSRGLKCHTIRIRRQLG